MVVAIAIFPFTEEKERDARRGLEKNLEWGKNQPGHIKSFIALSQDGSNRFLVYSEWKREEDFIAVKRKLMGRGVEEMEELFDWMDGEPLYGNFKVL